jgi:hypothetical protein
MDLVLDRPLAADVAGEVDGGGLAGVQAGDDEHRHGGLHLLLHPALSFFTRTVRVTYLSIRATWRA